MTAAIVTYRNVQIISPTPTGNAGLALNNNFIALSDQAAGLSTSITSTSNALSAHTALTAAHGTTGNVVGTSDTQTLTNKTITDATNNVSASILTSGLVPTARLGSGTASSSTFLRGDQTWTTVSSGAVSSVTNGNGLTLSGGVLSFSGAGYDAAGSASTAQAASLQKSNNLSDLANVATARTNLGLGTIATQSSSSYLSISGGTLTGPLLLSGNPGTPAVLGPSLTNNPNHGIGLTLYAGSSTGAASGGTLTLFAGTSTDGTNGSVVTNNNTLDDGYGNLTVAGSYFGDGSNLTGITASQVGADATGAVSTHAARTSGTHGVTGNLVGTQHEFLFIQHDQLGAERLETNHSSREFQ